MLDLHRLLTVFIQQGASDLHHMRLSTPIANRWASCTAEDSTLSPEDTRQICFSILTEKQRDRFIREHELDLSFGVKNLPLSGQSLHAEATVAAAFRPFRVATLLQQLGLPQVVTG